MQPYKLYALKGGEMSEFQYLNGVFLLGDTVVRITESGSIHVTSDKEAPERIRLIFPFEFTQSTRFLGDAWERGYGDLCWMYWDESRYMPWYFIANDDKNTYGFGVKTGANCFAYWTVSQGNVVLTLDLRSGTSSTLLNGRTLEAAQVVFYSASKDAFTGACEFCSELCDNPILPKIPVYGGNDWYCNYSGNTFDKIYRAASRISDCAAGLKERPFMVIDDGWQLTRMGGYNGGPWRYPNSKFGDMRKMADKIRELGVLPGIWFRPLLTLEHMPKECILEDRWNGENFHLDPSHPETLGYIASETKTLCSWGYKLLKYDFTSYDIFGCYGFDMGENLTHGKWSFSDKSRTTAEIIKQLYQTIRNAAGDDAMLIGCNTVGHLGAGLFEIQRTGDDTSGREWARTKKMGVNTLAFRMPQHGNFFACDADCVGITQMVPWEKNKMWLDVLAQSGTPLFVSVADNSYGDEQVQAIKQAFATCVETAKSGEMLKPCDWFERLTPQTWQRGNKIFRYDWDN